MRPALTILAILVASFVGFIGYLTHEMGLWPRPSLPSFPKPDETGLVEASRFEFEPWEPRVDSQRRQLEKFGFVLKQGSRYLYVRVARWPRTGRSMRPEIDETSVDWAAAYVYRYDVDSDSLERRPEADWPRGSVAVNCTGGVSADWNIARRDDGDYIRSGSDTVSETRAFGGNIVRFTRAPLRTKAVVVSAAGKHKWRTLGWPFPSGYKRTEGAVGQHYQQTITFPGRNWIGPTVKLPITNSIESMPGVCWTPDERFVVHFDAYRGSWISVAPAGVVAALE